MEAGTRVAGVSVKDAGTLPRVVARLPLGKSAELGYVRDGKPATFAVMEEAPTI